MKSFLKKLVEAVKGEEPGGDEAVASHSAAGSAQSSSDEIPEKLPPKVSLFFEVHQPNRLRPYTFFDIGNEPFYEDDDLNAEILDRVCDRCYLPANRMFRELIEATDGRFRLSMSLSGVFIEQLEHHRPDVLKSFVELHQTGGVELLAETYYHSLGFHRSKKEFAEQVALHGKKIREVFGVEPSVYRHTECVYYNEIAQFVENLGYKGMLGEAVGRVLQGRPANRLYRSPNVKEMKVLLRNGGLSDDVGFRFTNTDWDQYPLTAEKYASWILGSDGEVVNLFMDYETIGEHQGAESGIFEFWREWPEKLMELGGEFRTVSEVVDEFEVAGVYDCHEPTSWADAEKDLSPWKGNAMQEEARKKILNMEEAVKAKNDPELLHQWRKMQTSDHFYYMSTKGGEAGAVHDYFRPYNNAYDAYLFFMNALSDLQIRVEDSLDTRV